MSVDEYLIVRKTKRCVQFASNGMSGLQFDANIAVRFIKAALDDFQRVEQVSEVEMFNLWDDGGWLDMYVKDDAIHWEPIHP